MMESFSNRRFLSTEPNETDYHVEIVFKKAHHHISPLLIILVAILGGCFLVVSYYAIIVKFCSNLNNSRRPQQPQNEENDADDTLREDFLDENHGPVLDHPIWYIRTVGLAQTIIDSIAVVKYKKGEGLIEGTDCSICLSEFEEEETLRLLPKCSHAFHLSCIDTWLAAHTNCPSCRAPVVANSSLVPAPTSGVGQETTQVGNSENDGGLESELNGEDEVSDLSVRVQDEREEQERRGVEISKKDLLSPLEMSGFRVCSDLSDNHRVAQNGRQPVRRSASMDVNPASIFCFSGANSLPLDEEEKEDEGPSVVQLEKGKKANLSAGLPRLTGSSSNGKLFPKCPSIKRSFSSGGKLVSSRSSRNRSSILPLLELGDARHSTFVIIVVAILGGLSSSFSYYHKYV